MSFLPQKCSFKAKSHRRHGIPRGTQRMPDFFRYHSAHFGTAWARRGIQRRHVFLKNSRREFGRLDEGNIDAGLHFHLADFHDTSKGISPPSEIAAPMPAPTTTHPDIMAAKTATRSIFSILKNIRNSFRRLSAGGASRSSGHAIPYSFFVSASATLSRGGAEVTESFFSTSVTILWRACSRRRFVSLIVANPKAVDLQERVASLLQDEMSVY